MATVSRDDRRGGPWRGRVDQFNPLRGSILNAARAAGLGLLLWGVSTEVPFGTSDAQVAVWVLSATLVPAWLVWTAAPPPATSRLQIAALVWLAAAGGALSGLAPIGLVFVGVAALGAASALEASASLAVVAAGPAAAAITIGVDGRSPTVVLGAAAACLGGFLVGTGRRQYGERATQAMLLALEHDRADRKMLRE